MSVSTAFDASSVNPAELSPLRLSVRGGGCDGKTLSIRATDCAVGSGDECGIRLPGPAPEVICRFVRRADAVFVERVDPDALLNDRPFEEAEVRTGDRVAVDGIEIVLEEPLEPKRNGHRPLPFRRPDAGSSRRARWNGALLIGEVRRLQEDLRDATAADREMPTAFAHDEASRGDAQLLIAERAENARLRQELDAANRNASEMEATLQSVEAKIAESTSIREEVAALYEQTDALRSMLARSEEKIEELNRTHEARMQRAREVAEEEALAAAGRATLETEARLRQEAQRGEELLAEREAAAQSRIADLEERLASAERTIEKLSQRPEPASASASSERDAERARFEEEQAEFRRMQAQWDEERSEYERLAAEQTTLIAEKQRELQLARTRLEETEGAASNDATETSFIDDDRRAWEEEKAAFENVARTRMEELTEKTRAVEERLRAAAERQRQEIQAEREALAREREALLGAAPVDADASRADDDFASQPELAEPRFEAAVEEPSGDDDARRDGPESNSAEAESMAPPSGFRFIGGEFDETPIESTMVYAPQPARFGVESQEDREAVRDDRDPLDAEEAERHRLAAESRLARFASPVRDSGFGDDSTLQASDEDDAVIEDEAPESKGLSPEAGFLLRDFLGDEDDASDDAAEEPAEIAVPKTPWSLPSYASATSFEDAVEDEQPSRSIWSNASDEAGDDGDADSSNASAEYTSVSSPAAAAQSPVSQDPVGANGGDDDSVEEYMQRLLRRVRGESQVELTRPAAPVRPVETPKPAPAPAPEIHEEAPEETRLTEAEFTPRHAAPEQTDKLSAMRELANESARSAIFSSAVRKTYGKTATNAGLCGALTLFGVLALWFGADGSSLLVGAGLLMWAASGWFGYRAWNSRKELRRLSTPGGKS